MIVGQKALHKEQARKIAKLTTDRQDKEDKKNSLQKTKGEHPLNQARALSEPSV